MTTRTRGAPSNEWIARQAVTALRTIAGDRDAPPADGRAGHEIARSALDEVAAAFAQVKAADSALDELAAAFARVKAAEQNFDRVGRTLEALDRDARVAMEYRPAQLDEVGRMAPEEAWNAGYEAALWTVGKWPPQERNERDIFGGLSQAERDAAVAEYMNRCHDLEPLRSRGRRPR